MNDYYKCPKCNSWLLSRFTRTEREGIFHLRRVECFRCPKCGYFEYKY